MKREILFRGKRVDNGKLIDGYLVVNKDGTCWIKDTDYQVNNDKNDLIPHEVIPETIGQFTGLTDSDIDGNLVFEGDVIENCDTKQLQVVFWHEEKAAWYCRYIIDSDRIVSLANSIGNLNKVIGNIHDNPELLK